MSTVRQDGPVARSDYRPGFQNISQKLTVMRDRMSVCLSTRRGASNVLVNSALSVEEKPMQHGAVWRYLPSIDLDKKSQPAFREPGNGLNDRFPQN
jgi:hypothetical protein